MKIDSTLLSKCCEICFILSTDGRLSDDQRNRFRAMGKILRAHWLNLITAEFKKDTQAVIQANEDLADLNRRLDEVSKNMEKIAETLVAAASLAASLEKLLSVAIKFV